MTCCSIGGEHYQPDALVFEYIKDSLLEYARPVIIPIPHRVGQKIKMELYFSARWLLISEVKFESEIVKSEMETEVPPPSTPQISTLAPATTSNTQLNTQLSTLSLTSARPLSTDPSGVMPKHKVKVLDEDEDDYDEDLEEDNRSVNDNGEDLGKSGKYASEKRSLVESHCGHDNSTKQHHSLQE